MVFQTFALFPWLTVLQNVQAGLDAIGVAEGEARKRALAAIDLIGLDGLKTPIPGSSPAACASVSASRGPWSSIPRSC